MRKIIFHLSTGFAGMDSTENGTYSDDVTEEQLNLDAWQLALQNAEAYGIYPREDYDEEYMDDEDGDTYSDGIEGWWEDYDAKEHDGLVTGGGDWKWDV